MKRNVFYCCFLLVFLAGCAGGNAERRKEKAKNEILQAEKAFQKLAIEQGTGAAFVAFADDQATIVRGNKLVVGKELIREWYGHRKGPKTELYWTPDFVDASASGDLGYTYGKYKFIVTDSLGARKESTGIFHTVWKRQKDGSWKFVWD